MGNSSRYPWLDVIETHACPGCNGPSWLIGKTQVNEGKLVHNIGLKVYIKRFNALGISEQQMFLCRHCGLAFIRPFPSDEEIVALDAERRGAPAMDRIWSEPKFDGWKNTWASCVRAPRLNHIIQQRYSQPMRLLDVGAHGGTVSLRLDLPEGSAVDLLQADTEGARGSKGNIKVRQFPGILSDLREQIYRADVILALHVLEHVHSPREFLSDIRDLLTDGGICIIEVPYESSGIMDLATDRRMSGNHKSFFGPWSVLEAVRLAGMRVVDYEFMDCHWGGYSQFAPTVEPVIRVCAEAAADAASAARPCPPVYALAKALDAIFQDFAGSLAYLSDRPFRLFNQDKNALQLTRAFIESPGFRGLYSANKEIIDDAGIQNLATANLSPDEVIVVPELALRDELRRRCGNIIDII